MGGQLSFATLDYAGKKKRTATCFLAEVAAVVPWSVLEAVIAPHYPKEGLKAVVGRSDRRDVAHLLPAAMVQSV